jgi:hypothetical protein
VAVAVGVSLIGVLGAWAALSGSKKTGDTSDSRSREEQERNPNKVDNSKGENPKGTPKTNPKVDNGKGTPKGNPKIETPPNVVPGNEVLVYRFDPAEVGEFRVRQKGGAVLEGKKGPMPKGIAIYTLKEAEAEFEVGKSESTPIFAITRRAAGGDTHVAFELERETSSQGMGLKLKPDTDYKVRVKYRTDGAAQIGVGVHSLSYKGGSNKTFGATGGKWSTVDLAFHRAEEPMRLTIWVTGGTDVQVALGSVEVLEVQSAVDANGEKVISWLDLRGQKPFAIRSGLKPDSRDPARYEYSHISKSGSSEPPLGWTATVWNKDTEMEFAAEDVGGKPTLNIRNQRGPGSAMLFMPSFECPTSNCRLRFEYSTNAREGLCTVRFKPSDNRPAWDVFHPPATNGSWQTESQVCDLKGALGGFFEFHNNDNNPSAYLRLRSVTVTQLNGATERVLYKLEASELPDFKNTRRGRVLSSGTEPAPVKGLYFGGWKPETVSEWTCGMVAGFKAIGYTNVNEVNSAQIGLELEGEGGLGLKFEPGQLVRMRIEYLTSGRGHGRAYFQTYGDSRVFGIGELPRSNSEWKVVDVVTTREDKPLRCVIDTSETGTGNSLFIRSVTVSVPGTKPFSTPVPNPSGPAGKDLNK